MLCCILDMLCMADIADMLGTPLNMLWLFVDRIVILVRRHEDNLTLVVTVSHSNNVIYSLEQYTYCSSLIPAVVHCSETGK